MEQAQLFKRLYDMSMDEIKSFVLGNESIEASMYKLEIAARTRHIINNVQLEDLWQAVNYESNNVDIFLSMKLSPMALCSGLDRSEGMNNLEWRLVMPNYSFIAEADKPEFFSEYIGMMEKLEIISIEECNIDLCCEFLDMVYDFKLGNKKKPDPPAM